MPSAPGPAPGSWSSTIISYLKEKNDTEEMKEQLTSLSAPYARAKKQTNQETRSSLIPNEGRKQHWKTNDR